MNTGSLSHRNKSPEKFIYTAEKENKKKYLDSCLQKRCHFSPFVVLMDGLLVVEAESILKCIASRLATKFKQPYLQTYRYFNIKVCNPLVRSLHISISEERLVVKE